MDRSHIELSETIVTGRYEDVTVKSPSINYSTRGMLNTENPSAIKIRYRAKISEKYGLWLKCMGCMFPMSCMLCNADKYLQSTYVQIHENRVEYNYPSATFLQALLTCIGCNRFRDNVNVNYFDSDIGKNAARARCCSPVCTHQLCFPECCGICGESVVLYSTGCCGGLCCRRHAMINGLDNADHFVEKYEQAKIERFN